MAVRSLEMDPEADIRGFREPTERERETERERDSVRDLERDGERARERETNNNRERIEVRPESHGSYLVVELPAKGEIHRASTVTTLATQCYPGGALCILLTTSSIRVYHTFAQACVNPAWMCRSEQGQTQNNITDLELFSSWL